LVWVWLYRREVYCLVWGVTYVRAAITFWWEWYLVVSVLQNMFLCQVSLLSRRSPRYLTSAWRNCTLFMWTEVHVSLRVVKVTWVDLEPLAFILRFLNKCWIVSRLVCSLCEAMGGSLSMVVTVVSSAKVV
jgi:hypothetical protein